METEIILVDKKDQELGRMGKIEAHEKGRLHRAFSIFIFNPKGQLLVQKRAEKKYHSGGLWSNTCCSHPRADEATDGAARRRLKEEMGIEADLKEIFSFVYKAKVGGLLEHEFLHVFFGKFDGDPAPNKNEAADWKWLAKRELIKDVKENPEKYTAWFRIILDKSADKIPFWK